MTYQSLFDVTQVDVLKRVGASFNPIKPKLKDALAEKADLYGPFWLYTTCIFLLTISEFFHNELNSSSTVSFDMARIPSSATLIYIWGFGIPVGLAFLLKQMIDSKLDIVRVISIYGYSWSSIAVAIIFCALPWNLTQWVTLAIAIPFNIWIIILNYLMDKQMNLQSKLITIATISVSQLVLLLSFKIFYLKTL